MSCHEITVPEMQHKLLRGDDVYMLDVREVHEYRAGHVEGAELIPIGILPYRLPQVEYDKEIIVMCHSGNRSTEACQVLRQNGFSNVKSLRGGLINWSS